MNIMVGYFSRRKAFHIVEWFETYGEAIDWLRQKVNVRKDFVIFQRAAQQTLALDAAPAGVSDNKVEQGARQ